MSMFPKLLLVGTALLILAWLPRAPAEESHLTEVAAVPIAALTDWDHRNLERNLRWMLQRERQPAAGKAKVAVFADAGVWHAGARSIVDALEQEHITCRVIDRSQVRDNLLRDYDGLVLPGGWAPYQREALGKEGWEAICSFVERGGRCLAICAGAYLVSRETKYDGVTYPYPIGLFDGVAQGAIPGLAVFPKPGSVAVTVTIAGQRRGLGDLTGHACYFSGGPCFVGGSQLQILATYPDKSPAAVSRSVGKGEVILLGMHVERPAPEIGGDDAATPAVAAKIFRKLLYPMPNANGDK